MSKVVSDTFTNWNGFRYQTQKIGIRQLVVLTLGYLNGTVTPQQLFDSTQISFQHLTPRHSIALRHYQTFQNLLNKLARLSIVRLEIEKGEYIVALTGQGQGEFEAVEHRLIEDGLLHVLIDLDKKLNRN